MKLPKLDLDDSHKIRSRVEASVRIPSGVGGRAPEKLLSVIALDLEEHHDLVPSYITTLCSGIEARINNTIITYFHEHVGSEHAEHAKPYLLLPFQKKLAIVVPLISKYQYKLKNKSSKLKKLLFLFGLRNRLVHMSDKIVPGYRLYYDNFYDEELPFEDREYFYTNERYKDQSVKDLESYYELYRECIEFFYELYPRITEKHFDPRDWFKEIQK